MSIPVLLTIKSEQHYEGQEPDTIEMMTDGWLQDMGGNTWKISYEESELTGMQGVTTTFSANPEKVILTRSGALESQMVFEENVRHDSLYQLEFGALMMGICAQKIQMDLGANGGFLEVLYGIQIEKTQAGTVSYHIDVRPKP